jgi:hypothetical protein
LKYGGLPSLASLAAPGELLINDPAPSDLSWTKSAYEASGASDKLRVEKSASSTATLQWLAR